MSLGQLSLDLGFTPRFGADDYLVAPSNADAHALLTGWPRWPAHILVLVGPEGAGKTHLASIWAEMSNARVVDPSALALETITDLVEPALLIEDADRSPFDEQAMFHLINQVRERRHHLLLTARGAPDQWRLSIPDLLSRLRLAPLLQLEAPDDHLLRAVLVKLFVDRQLAVDAGVIEYLTRHLDRSLGAARRLVDALDRTSLAEHRKITRPVVAEVLTTLNA